MPETLQRSRYHRRAHATLRHCVALVRWEHGEYSTHYEVHAGPPTDACYFHQGDYFPTEQAAREDFADRADRFERRYWKFLEPAGAGPTGQPLGPAPGDRCDRCGHE